MNAAAYVVGPQTGSDQIIHELATKLGFEAVLPYVGLADAERRAASTPLSFFLFSEVPEVRSLAATTQAIRFSGGMPLRLSPMIYFCRTPSVEVIRNCLNMGFDDVITAPFTPTRVRERLRRQIDTQLVYFETPNYLGPERRRGDAMVAPGPRGGDDMHRRLEIVRHGGTGISVLSDDLQIVL